MRDPQKRRFLPEVDPCDHRALLSMIIGVHHPVAHGTEASLSAPRHFAPDVVSHPAHLTGGQGVEAQRLHAHRHVRPRVHAVHHRRTSPQLFSWPMPTLPSYPAPSPVVAPPAPAPSPPGPGVMGAMGQQIVNLVNQQRQQNGLAPLSVNTKLVEMAQIHSRDMAQLGVMEHDLPGVAQPTLESRASYVGYNFMWLGENIAFGFPDAPSVMAGWMNSPEHRANILNPNYTEIGVAAAIGQGGQIYYTQVFGEPA